MGVAFKPGTDDVREAPSLDLIDYLVRDGAQVKAYDPHALDAAARVVPSSVLLTGDIGECAEGAEALVLMTEWSEIVDADWEDLARKSTSPRYLFDGRNALDPVFMESLGFEYKGVGRGAEPKSIADVNPNSKVR